jgi:tetratricopeptide (TPR) repeat protein
LRHDILSEDVSKLIGRATIQLAAPRVAIRGGRSKRLRWFLAFIAVIFVALTITPTAFAQSRQETEAHAYYNRGYARQTQRDLDGAMTEYGKAIRLNPNSAEAYIGRGSVRIDMGDLDGAIADYDRAIQIEPNNINAYFGRSLARYSKSDLDGAIADYDQTIRLEPTYSDAYFNRGLVRYDKGDFDGAIADYDQAIRLNPKDPLAYDNRGDAQKDKGDLDAAIADYDQAIRLDPSFAAAYTGRGLAYEAKKDSVRARADFSAALAAPENSENGKWAHDMARRHLTGTSSGKRIALVIGNSTYTNVPRLANPVNDARLMAETLRALGFVLVGNGAQLDLDKAAFDKMVQRFGIESRGADVGLFYYAGHGMQLRGSNYLIPVDANPTHEADVDFQMLDANLVLRQMADAGTKLNLVILDACRNNPFGGRGLRATESGLALMLAPEGTLISFATQPGSVALDGYEGNSPFSKALAQIIRKPGLNIFGTFNEVGLAVASATGNAQRPWFSTSPIKGNFYFAGPAAPLDIPIRDRRGF